MPLLKDSAGGPAKTAAISTMLILAHVIGYTSSASSRSTPTGGLSTREEPLNWAVQSQSLASLLTYFLPLCRNIYKASTYLHPIPVVLLLLLVLPNFRNNHSRILFCRLHHLALLLTGSFNGDLFEKIDTGATDAFIVQRISPLKDLAKRQQINEEPVRARLIFSNKGAALSARMLLMSVQSMIDDKYVPTECTEAAELRESAPFPQQVPAAGPPAPPAPTVANVSVSSSSQRSTEATAMQVDSPRPGIRGISLFQSPGSTSRSNALVELEREQERQKNQLLGLETRVDKNTQAIIAVPTDVHSLVQQQAVHRKMEGNDWHLPGRIDAKAKPLLRGWVRKPVIGDDYYILDLSASGDAFSLQHASVVDVTGRFVSWVQKGEDPDEGFVTVTQFDWVYQTSNKANTIAEALTDTLRQQINEVAELTEKPEDRSPPAKAPDDASSSSPAQPLDA